MTNLRSSKKIRESETGSVLPLILVLFAILSALAFGVGGLMQSRREEIKKVNERLSAKYVAKHFENFVKRPRVWQKVLEKNSNLSCLQTGGCGTSPIEIRYLADASGTVLFDRQNSRQGFTPSGSACENAGSGDCVFRLKMTLQPGSVVRGEIELVGQERAFNSGNYKFEVPK